MHPVTSQRPVARLYPRTGVRVCSHRTMDFAASGDLPTLPTGIAGRSRATGSYFRLISTVPAIFPISSTTKCQQKTWEQRAEPTLSGFPEMLQNGVWSIVASQGQLALEWDRVGRWGRFTAVPWSVLGTRLRFHRGLSVHGRRLKRLQP